MATVRRGFFEMEEEGVLRLDLGIESENENSTKCLIGTVFSQKQFNSFGFLEAMKRAMAPTRGFEAREIGNNLFSFQFNSEDDMRAVLAREPWHFDKSVVMLQELNRGSQPSTITLTHAAFWVRIYDLPMAARTPGSINLIAGKIGGMVEIDQSSIKGFGRSVRVKIKIDLTKPLLKGIHLEIQRGRKLWIDFKYERLPSFCYICGSLGHMRRECHLLDGSKIIENLPDTKLPFGDWLRDSPGKKATVSMEVNPPKRESTSIRRQLFEKFVESVTKEGAEVCGEMSKGTETSKIHRMDEDAICEQMGLIGVQMQETLEKDKKTHQGSRDHTSEEVAISLSGENNRPTTPFINHPHCPTTTLNTPPSTINPPPPRTPPMTFQGHYTNDKSPFTHNDTPLHEAHQQVTYTLPSVSQTQQKKLNLPNTMPTDTALSPFNTLKSLCLKTKPTTFKKYPPKNTAARPNTPFQ
ncbi:hypothetical protein ACS0TY_010918 [Phlomoides rotata]